RVPRGLLGRRAQREARPAAGGAAPVARLVGDDAQQPRPEGRALAKAAERAPRLHETVLRRVLGVARVARDQVGGAEGDALVCVPELLVGVCAAALGASDQPRFVEWSAPHRRSYTAVSAEVPQFQASAESSPTRSAGSSRRRTTGWLG